MILPNSGTSITFPGSFLPPRETSNAKDPVTRAAGRGFFSTSFRYFAHSPAKLAGGAAAPIASRNFASSRYGVSELGGFRASSSNFSVTPTGTPATLRPSNLVPRNVTVGTWPFSLGCSVAICETTRSAVTTSRTFRSSMEQVVSVIHG